MNEPQPDQILQVGLGFWASKTLLSAVEMGLFTELAKHPEDLETLQGRLGLHPRSVAFSKWPTIGYIRFGLTSLPRSERHFRKTKRETAAPTLSRPFTPNR